VDATPISVPAWVRNTRSDSLVKLDSATLQIETVGTQGFSLFLSKPAKASFLKVLSLSVEMTHSDRHSLIFCNAAKVSAVSPD
jgi:hypothetical protein